MSENLPPQIPEQLTEVPEHVSVFLNTAFEKMANYKNDGVPIASPQVKEFFASEVELEPSLLNDYMRVVQFSSDETAKFGNNPKGYFYNNTLRDLCEITPNNLKRLYFSDVENNSYKDMLKTVFTMPKIELGYAVSAVTHLKTVYDSDNILGVINNKDNVDPIVVQAGASVRSGSLSLMTLERADIGHNIQNGTQEAREWYREAIMAATDVEDASQADSYTYALSRGNFGMYLTDGLAKRINEFGPAKLQTILEFSGISSLSSYTDEQLTLMHEVATGNQDEIDRLKQHDVNVVFVNRDGDHNGVSAEVTQRVDDEQQRTLFFEISNPLQIYQNMKKLHELGITPSTMLFAAHGSAGQYIISERPALDESKGVMHVASHHGQDLLDEVTKDDPKLEGYSLEKANGLIRSIERFMQPSRGIDDPDNDLGRKKIISLSCQFDAEVFRAVIGPDGERMRIAKVSLMRRLGEVLAERLVDQQIDIYGADISTNKQTRTQSGFHYNTMRNGAISPYTASVLHVDGTSLSWHKLNEVKLRKVK
jgi:hypothetical protein